MIYPRFTHRHIALLGLFLLLTLGVMGLFFILCIYNDIQLQFIVSSDQFRNGQTNIKNWKYLNVRHPSGEDSPLYVIEKDSLHNAATANELEQQNIYIDDFDKLFTNRSEEDLAKWNNSSKEIETNQSKYDSKASNKSPERSFETTLDLAFDDSDHYELDSEDDDSDEPHQKQIASGSGAGWLSVNERYDDNYDMETKNFIKRISLKLLQLSKKNATYSQIASTKRKQNGKSQIVKQTKLKLQQKKRKDLVNAAADSNYLKTGADTRPLGTTNIPTATDTLKHSILSKLWLETRTRRIIGNERKSAERSRQLLLCEKDKAGGGELCRMLFKGT